MDVNHCWIAYRIDYATGEGMHYVLALANSPERAVQLFDQRAIKLFRRQSTTSPLGEFLEKYPGVRAVIPDEVHGRTTDPLCWTLEYFATIDFNCA